MSGGRYSSKNRFDSEIDYIISLFNAVDTKLLSTPFLDGAASYKSILDNLISYQKISVQAEDVIKKYSQMEYSKYKSPKPEKKLEAIKTAKWKYHINLDKARYTLIDTMYDSLSQLKKHSDSPVLVSKLRKEVNDLDDILLGTQEFEGIVPLLGVNAKKAKKYHASRKKFPLLQSKLDLLVKKYVSAITTSQLVSAAKSCLAENKNPLLFRSNLYSQSKSLKYYEGIQLLEAYSLEANKVLSKPDDYIKNKKQIIQSLKHIKELKNYFIAPLTSFDTFLSKKNEFISLKKSSISHADSLFLKELYTTFTLELEKTSLSYESAFLKYKEFLKKEDKKRKKKYSKSFLSNKKNSMNTHTYSRDKQGFLDGITESTSNKSFQNKKSINTQYTNNAISSATFPSKKFSLPAYLWTIGFPKESELISLWKILSGKSVSSTWSERLNEYIFALKEMPSISSESKPYINQLAAGLHLAIEHAQEGFPIDDARRAFESTNSYLKRAT